MHLESVLSWEEFLFDALDIFLMFIICKRGQKMENCKNFPVVLNKEEISLGISLEYLIDLVY